MDDFDGMTLLVTGGATGLGAAVAAMAVARGARVAILDLNDAAGHETAAQVGARFWHCDVSDPAVWSQTTDAVERDLGPVRFAHLNAGVMTQELGASVAEAAFEKLSVERYRKVLGVNVDGVVFGLKELIPRLTSAGGHAVTVTSSAAGLVPIPFDPLYALTKHAVVGLVRSLAIAHAGGPVRINAICPGGFASPLIPPEFHSDRNMRPEEVAAEVIELLLNGASGETRVKLQSALPAQAVPPPDFQIG